MGQRMHGHSSQTPCQTLDAKQPPRPRQEASATAAAAQTVNPDLRTDARENPQTHSKLRTSTFTKDGDFESFRHHTGPTSATCQTWHDDSPTPSRPAQVSLSQTEALQTTYESWLAKSRSLQDLSTEQRCEIASRHPPISASSLSELEIDHITQNARLRHDINFDRELHFRPNTDGERGLQKIRAAETYWLALKRDLDVCSFMLTDHDGQHFRWTKQWRSDLQLRQERLGKLFGVVIEILKTLIPERDQPHVDEALDVPLMMQQIERGLFDAAALSRWLAQLLKTHCAPMRDYMVDRMVEKMVQGSSTSDTNAMVDGLRELLGILECMKLDVANHQVRHLRPVLLESTVHFEKTYWARKMKHRHVKVEAIQSWCREAASHCESASLTPTNDPAEAQKGVQLFVRAFVATSMPHTTNSVRPVLSWPAIFELDKDRLVDLGAEVQTHIYTSICITRLREILLKNLPNAHRGSLAAIRAEAALAVKVPLLLGTRINIPQIGYGNASNIAAEIVRIALSVESDSPSPLASPYHGAATGSADLVDATEQWLLKHADPGSAVFEAHAQAMSRRLFNEVFCTTQAHLDLSPNALFEALCASTTAFAPTSADIASALWASTSTLPNDFEDCHGGGFDGTVRRAAHIAVLHWHVFASLVYQVDEPLVDADVDVDGDVDVDVDIAVDVDAK